MYPVSQRNKTSLYTQTLYTDILCTCLYTQFMLLNFYWMLSTPSNFKCKLLICWEHHIPHISVKQRPHIATHTTWNYVELGLCHHCPPALLSDHYPCSSVACHFSSSTLLILCTVYQSLRHFFLFTNNLGTQIILFLSGQTALSALNSTF